MGFPKEIQQLDPGVGTIPSNFLFPARDPAGGPAKKWEVSQLPGGGGGGLTAADNGLSVSGGDTVELGGTLTKDTNIDTATFDLKVLSGTGALSIQKVTSNVLDFAIDTGIDGASKETNFSVESTGVFGTTTDGVHSSLLYFEPVRTNLQTGLFLLNGNQQIPDPGYFEFLQVNDNYSNAYLTPKNYGTNYGVGSTGVANRFTQSVALFAGVNAPDPRPNVVAQMWGYNGAPGGGRIDTNEPAFQFRTETYWNMVGSHFFEFHIPEVTDITGNSLRYWSIYAGRSGSYGWIHTQAAFIQMNLIADNNTGVWAIEQLSPTGQVQMFLDSSHGTGGSAGTQANVAKITFIDGTGTLSQINMNNGELDLGSIANKTYLSGGRIYMDKYIRFSGGNTTGDGSVWLNAFTDDPGKGFRLINQSEDYLMRIMNDGTYTDRILYIRGDRDPNHLALAPINVLPTADPTNTAGVGYMQMWNDGTNWFTYVGGVKKTFVLV